MRDMSTPKILLVVFAVVLGSFGLSWIFIRPTPKRAQFTEETATATRANGTRLIRLTQKIIVSSSREDVILARKLREKGDLVNLSMMLSTGILKEFSPEVLEVSDAGDGVSSVTDADYGTEHYYTFTSSLSGQELTRVQLNAARSREAADLAKAAAAQQAAQQAEQTRKKAAEAKYWAQFKYRIHMEVSASCKVYYVDDAQVVAISVANEHGHYQDDRNEFQFKEEHGAMMPVIKKHDGSYDIWAKEDIEIEGVFCDDGKVPTDFINITINDKPCHAEWKNERATRNPWYYVVDVPRQCSAIDAENSSGK